MVVFRRESCGVGLRKMIKGIWGSFKAKTRFVIRNGRRIKSW